jgi:hypothetical protein
VIHSRHLGDVVDVVDQHGKRRPRNAVGVGPLQLVDLVLQGSKLLSRPSALPSPSASATALSTSGLHGLLRVAVVLRQKRGVEVHLHHAALRIRAAVVAIARSMSSVMLRGASHSARADECEAITGAREMTSVR